MGNIFRKNSTAQNANWQAAATAQHAASPSKFSQYVRNIGISVIATGIIVASTFNFTGCSSSKEASGNGKNGEAAEKSSKYAYSPAKPYRQNLPDMNGKKAYLKVDASGIRLFTAAGNGKYSSATLPLPEGVDSTDNYKAFAVPNSKTGLAALYYNGSLLILEVQKNRLALKNHFELPEFVNADSGAAPYTRIRFESLKQPQASKKNTGGKGGKTKGKTETASAKPSSFHIRMDGSTTYYTYAVGADTLYCTKPKCVETKDVIVCADGGHPNSSITGTPKNSTDGSLPKTTPRARPQKKHGVDSTESSGGQPGNRNSDPIFEAPFNGAPAPKNKPLPKGKKEAIPNEENDTPKPSTIFVDKFPLAGGPRMPEAPFTDWQPKNSLKYPDNPAPINTQGKGSTDGYLNLPLGIVGVYTEADGKLTVTDQLFGKGEVLGTYTLKDFTDNSGKPIPADRVRIKSRQRSDGRYEGVVYNTLNGARYVLDSNKQLHSRW